MKFTLIQAAIETGKDRSTLFRAIKKGRLSAEIQNDKSYLIDSSELFRVYQPKAKQDDAQQCALDEMQQYAQGELVGALRAQIEILRDQVNRERDQTDHWRKQATMLLEHQPQRVQEEIKINSELSKRAGSSENSLLWRKLFGKRGG